MMLYFLRNCVGYLSVLRFQLYCLNLGLYENFTYSRVSVYDMHDCSSKRGETISNATQGESKSNFE